MQMPLTHWKMRIRPGIAEIFFLAVRRFSVRQFLSHFVLVSRFACFFFFFLTIVLLETLMEQNLTLSTWEKPDFSLPVFPHNGAIWRLQEMRDWFWGRENWGWRRYVEQLYLLLTCHQQFVSQQHWAGSGLWTSVSHWTKTHQKGKWNLFFRV